MKIMATAAALGVLLAAWAAPALAQNAPEPPRAEKNDADKRNETLRLYFSAMECAYSAVYIATLDPVQTEAQKVALNEEAVFWLRIAEPLGQTLSRNYQAELSDMGQRGLAELDLLGTEIATQRYQPLRGPCNAIYAQVIKTP